MRNLSDQSYDFSKELNENKFNLSEQIVLLLHYFITWRRKKCSIFAKMRSEKKGRSLMIVKVHLHYLRDIFRTYHPITLFCMFIAYHHLMFLFTRSFLTPGVPAQ